MVNEIIIARLENETIAFKSEKAFFRWMRETKRSFHDHDGIQDRSIAWAAEDEHYAEISYECTLFSAKDPISMLR